MANVNANPNAVPAAAAAAPADINAALGQHETRRRATELPPFYGRPDVDICTAQLLIERFETAARIANWDTDARKCQQFYLLLRDKAMEWWKSLKRIPDFDLENWANVKRDFLRAYQPKYTARSACANLQELYQKNNETVQDFYLRCLTSYDKLEEIMDPNMLTARLVIQNITPANAALFKKEGIHDTFRFVMQQIFIAGLKEEIRLKTMEANPRELQETLIVAQQMELIVGDKKTRGHINAVQGDYLFFTEDESDEDPDLPEEAVAALEKVNAVFKRNGVNFKRFVGKRNRFARRTSTNLKCHGCGQKGHLIKNCYSKKKRLNAILGESDEEEEDRPKQPDETDLQDIQDYYAVAAINKISLN